MLVVLAVVIGGNPDMEQTGTFSQTYVIELFFFLVCDSPKVIIHTAFCLRDARDAEIS